ncbi:MAG TPA: glycosyltransferase [Candidatus Sulfomarinibacteraceae bacterium]|nr:glycosyltransferase [Candidatus Sulfomarinibacteraceae bacterium]
MPLRIGLLHYTAPPVVGGVEVVLEQHARLMVDAGHRVRIITGRGGIRGPRLEVVRIPLADTRHPAIRAMRACLDRGEVPEGFSRLAAEVASALGAAIEDLDVVVAHNVCSLHFNLPLTAALHELVGRAGAPGLIAWQHDLAWTSSRYASELHAGYPWDLLRAAWPRTTYVAVSEARREEQARLSGLAAAVPVVPNGVELERLLAIHPATRRILDGFGLPGDGPVLLVPVRITPRKNLELAIGIVAALRASGDDARLIVTGPPDPHASGSAAGVARLRAIAREGGVEGSIHLLAVDRGRRTPQRVVHDLYRIADALLLPSHDEGFGLPVLEAAAARLPVFCADLPSLRELAGDDASYFDPAADPAAVAAVIRTRLASEPVARLAMRARRTYGWRAIYRSQIEGLLAEAAERR